jgi:hypothetical protein
MYQFDKLTDLIQNRAAERRAFSPDDLEDLIAWLETQPADREYQWPDVCGCLMHFYLLEACAVPSPSESAWHYDEPFGTLDAYHQVGATWPWTFGAALKRAKVLLDQPQK